MRDRVKTLKRILDVQRHLSSMEELKYARLNQRLVRCRAEQQELVDAFSHEDALQGLFVDLTARRLKSLQQEEAKLGAAVEAQAKILLAHNARLRKSERLSEELAQEVRRDEERRELERLIEAGFAQNASSKQDH